MWNYDPQPEAPDGFRMALVAYFVAVALIIAALAYGIVAHA